MAASPVAFTARATAPADTAARPPPPLGKLARLALLLHRGGATKMKYSNYGHGGGHFTVCFPAGPPAGAASGQRGGQGRHRGQPDHPRGAQAESWRRNTAFHPGQPRRRKANVAASGQPRRRKANVAASAPGQQEGGTAKQRRDAKRKTARHERVSAAPAAPPQDNPGGGGGQQPGTGQPPYRDTQETSLESSLVKGEAPDVGVQTLTYMSISKMQEYPNKSFEELRCENYARGNKGSADPPAGLTLVVAPAKAQEVGAPEEIAPEAAGELGAGTHAPLAASPTIPSCSRLVKAAMPETKEAAVPATPPRALLATACPPSSDKQGPSRSRSSASSGSSGGRPSLSPHRC